MCMVLYFTCSAPALCGCIGADSGYVCRPSDHVRCVLLTLVKRKTRVCNNYMDMNLLVVYSLPFGTSCKNAFLVVYCLHGYKFSLVPLGSLIF